MVTAGTLAHHALGMHGLAERYHLGLGQFAVAINIGLFEGDRGTSGHLLMGCVDLGATDLAVTVGVDPLHHRGVTIARVTLRPLALACAAHHARRLRGRIGRRCCSRRTRSGLCHDGTHRQGRGHGTGGEREGTKRNFRSSHCMLDNEEGNTQDRAMPARAPAGLPRVASVTT
jgi:hypothetical protein